MSTNNGSVTPQGGTRSGGRAVPRQVSRRESPDSAGDLSDMTTPSRRPRQNNDTERIDELPLAALAAGDDAISPVKRLSAFEEEETMDAMAYADNPVAADSKDEDEHGMGIINSALLDVKSEQESHADDSAVAAVDFAEYLESYSWQMQEEEDAKNVHDGLLNAVLGIVDNVMDEDERLPGAPAKWKKPGAPPGWEPRQPRRGQPANFADIDNPGGWSEFTFRPKFNGTNGSGNYLQHQLPTGATPLPANENGKRVVNDWELHYQGWDNPG